MNVYARQLEHAAMLMSGQYCVYSPNHVGDDFWKFWKDIRADIELGVARTQYRRPKKNDDIPARLNIAEWARSNMECTYVTWAHVDSEPQPKETKTKLRRIEARVNHQIKSLMISEGIELNDGQRHIVPGTADKPSAEYTVTHYGASIVTSLLPHSEDKGVVGRTTRRGMVKSQWVLHHPWHAPRSK
jgi:hypothetical protein